MYSKTNLQNSQRMRLITIVSTIGGLCFGYDTSMISGALIFVEYDLNMTPSLIFITKYFPETRGLTLEKIENNSLLATKE